MIEANPVANTNSAGIIAARERVVSDEELVAIWRALEDDQYGAIVKLLVLTGARRDEIASLRWSEVDLDTAMITLPPARTKNCREQQIPLAPGALAILQAQPRRMQPDGSPRDLVFDYAARGFHDWSGSELDLSARIKEVQGKPIADWRLHDFRRSMSTAMHERLGVQPHVVEAVLGHVSGHLAGVSGVYNKSSYTELKSVAPEKWATAGISAGWIWCRAVCLRVGDHSWLEADGWVFDASNVRPVLVLPVHAYRALRGVSPL